jgi:hypothetical protein
MAAKPDGTRFPISEQIFDDPVTGICFQFLAEPDNLEAPFRLRLFGNIPYEDHEFMFDKNGIIQDGEVILVRRPRPSWLHRVKS